MSLYLLTQEAEQDLDDVSEYLLAEGGIDLVRYVLGHVQRGMQLIGNMPGIGHLRQDLTVHPVKF